MRLSPILRYPLKYKELTDKSWTRWRRQVVIDDGIKAALEAKGIPVVDANEFVKDLSPLALDINAIPEPAPIFPVPPGNDRSHPDWHEERCHSFGRTSFPADGVAQAQFFTRSVQICKGLPESILQIGNAAKIKDEHQLAENAIKQAFLWDAVLKKLPKLLNLEIPSHGFPREWGIPAARVHENLVRNMLLLCEMEFPQNPTSKVITEKQEIRLGVTRHGSYTQFNLPTVATVLSRNLLSPLAVNEDEVKSKPVPNIYPFNSLANFERANVYKTTDFLAFKADSPFPYIQTQFFSHDIPGSFTHIRPRWNEDRFSGSIVLHPRRLWPNVNTGMMSKYCPLPYELKRCT
jgi:hypothetical protein